MNPGQSSTTNFPTGTMNTENFSLKASEICRIIKQCHDFGVSEFDFQGVSFKFHPRRNEDAVQPGPASDHIHINIPVVSEFEEGQRDQAQLMDEETLLEAEEAQMLIDDPFAFERTQMDRHIEKARALNEKT